jgi:ankyrin repeat protein
MGHNDILQLLLQQPTSSTLVNNAVNADSATPLHAAAMAGSAACVQLLLQHGADAGLAGSGGMLPWEVVAADTPEIQQQELVKQLQEAAGRSSSSSAKNVSSSVYAGSSTSSSNSKETAVAPGPAADAAHAAGTPIATYGVQFAGLNATEQGRKVDTFARMSEQEVAQLDFLSTEAKQAISQVCDHGLVGELPRLLCILLLSVLPLSSPSYAYSMCNKHMHIPCVTNICIFHV